MSAVRMCASVRRPASETRPIARTLRFSAISTHLYCSRSSAHTTESFVAFTVAPRFDPYNSAGSPNHEAGPKWATRRAGSDVEPSEVDDVKLRAEVALDDQLGARLHLVLAHHRHQVQQLLGGEGAEHEELLQQFDEPLRHLRGRTGRSGWVRECRARGVLSLIHI